MSIARRACDALYRASGAVAVLCLVLIAVFTLSQVAARLLGTIVPSADDFAGFCMAGAVFIGLTHTLRAGGHVRMLVVFQRLGPAARQRAEAVCAGGAATIVGILLWYTADMIRTTHRLGEQTLGLVPIPKWIPMLLMLLGLAILFIALVDEVVRVLRGERPVYALREAEEGLPSATAE
jgi:TRAP-type C4-dicarboxylate transport system permease small subunit